MFFGRFQFIAHGHHCEAAEGGLIGWFSIDEDRIELGDEGVEIARFGGLGTVTDLAALGALGPAELDFSQPDEKVGFPLLGGLPDGGEDNCTAFSAGILDLGAVDLEESEGDAQQRGDVVIVGADARPFLDVDEFGFGDGWQRVLGGC